MKKIYQTPSVIVTEIVLTQMLAASITDTDGNAGIDYGGGGSGPARVKDNGGFWNDEDDWDEWN